MRTLIRPPARQSLLALPKPSMAAPSQKHAESWNRPRAPRVLQLQPHDLFDDRFVLPTPSPALVGADPIPSRKLLRILHRLPACRAYCAYWLFREAVIEAKGRGCIIRRLQVIAQAIRVDVSASPPRLSVLPSRAGGLETPGNCFGRTFPWNGSWHDKKMDSRG